MPSLFISPSTWFTQPTSGLPFSKSIPNCSLLGYWPTTTEFSISKSRRNTVVTRSVTKTSIWPLSSADLKSLVES